MGGFDMGLGLNSYFTMENHGYQLLDFGDGRKLEKLGQVVLDRVSPAAEGIQRKHSHWKTAELFGTSSSYIRLDEHGEITDGKVLSGSWIAEIGKLRFHLKITPFGHVGLFPEQAENWRWLQQLLIAKSYVPQALNLFAYTGGSTLALALAGFQVVHVDASAPAVRWARENALLNQLDQKPIRWIVEDARKFTSRELKRGRQYDAIVLDPPSFGHGPKGDRWEIDVDLFPLLDICLGLLNPGGSLLFSAHATIPNLDEVKDWFNQKLEGRFRMQSQRLGLKDLSQRELDCGYCIRLNG
jgi:23S rRNA (cytosine1962-C5)-methyltransferase